MDRDGDRSDCGSGPARAQPRWRDMYCVHEACKRDLWAIATRRTRDAPLGRDVLHQLKPMLTVMSGWSVEEVILIEP